MKRTLVLLVVLAVTAVIFSAFLPQLAILHANPIHATCYEGEDYVYDSLGVQVKYKSGEPEYQKILNLVGGWCWDYYIKSGTLPNTQAEITYTIYDASGKTCSSGKIVDKTVGYCFYGWPPGSRGYTGSMPTLTVSASGKIKIPSTVGWGGVCKFTIKISGFISYSGSGSTKIYLHVLEREEPPEVEQPPTESAHSSPITAPPKPAFQSIVDMLKAILNRIWGWLREMLSFQFVQLSEKLSVVTGEIAYPGDTFQHQFTLKNTKSVSIPDSDYHDGAATFAYVIWFVVDEDGAIIYSADPIEVTSLLSGGTYSITASWQIPESAEGKYAITAVLLEIPMRWDSSQQKWTQGEPIIVDKQAVDVNVNPIPAPPKPDPWSWLMSLWNALIEWLRNIIPFLGGEKS